MRALIVVDLQYDFLPGGALAVSQGDATVPVANRMMPKFELVVATQDWHPANHGSFASQYPGKQPGEFINLNGLQQILWPDHCIQDSHGAEFHQDLDQSRIHKIFPKGTDPGIDSYSGFYDNAHRQATGLGDYLKTKGVNEIYILGLATDYCVKFTALDAIGLGFTTTVIVDGCRGVNLQAEDTDKAIAEMQSAGVRIVQSAEVSET